MTTVPRRFTILTLVTASIVALDQVTKSYIANMMHLHQSIPILPGYFNLTYIRNPGAAFGLLASSSSGFRMIFFVSSSLFALGLLAVIFFRLQPDDWWGQLTISSIFGGAIGNLIDRLQFGEVIDFLDFYIRTKGYDFNFTFLGYHFNFYFDEYHWPAFNVADTAICIGVISLIFLFAFEKRRSKPEMPDKAKVGDPLRAP